MVLPLFFFFAFFLWSCKSRGAITVCFTRFFRSIYVHAAPYLHAYTNINCRTEFGSSYMFLSGCCTAKLLFSAARGSSSVNARLQKTYCDPAFRNYTRLSWATWLFIKATTRPNSTSRTTFQMPANESWRWNASPNAVRPSGGLLSRVFDVVAMCLYTF